MHNSLPVHAMQPSSLLRSWLRAQYFEDLVHLCITWATFEANSWISNCTVHPSSAYHVSLASVLVSCIGLLPVWWNQDPFLNSSWGLTIASASATSLSEMNLVSKDYTVVLQAIFSSTGWVVWQTVTKNLICILTFFCLPCIIGICIGVMHWVTSCMVKSRSISQLILRVDSAIASASATSLSEMNLVSKITQLYCKPIFSSTGWVVWQTVTKNLICILTYCHINSSSISILTYYFKHLFLNSCIPCFVWLIPL